MITGDIERALQEFWAVRSEQEALAVASGFQGSAARQAGHLGGFDRLICEMWECAGIDPSDIRNRNARLPGHFREVKNWDIAALSGSSLVGAVELKSQVGSVGKNQNNRLEEVMGSGYDARSAHEVNGLFGPTGVWLGYLFVLGGGDDVHAPVRSRASLIGTDPAFHGASYTERYALAIRRLLDRGLYDACWFIVTELDEDGGILYSEPVPEASGAVFEERLYSRSREVRLMRGY